MDLNPRTQRRLNRIRDEVDILVLLENFGFRVRSNMDREQQFSCHLHGSGQDNKPSARVYPDTQSWYCWACQKTRDAISTVREVENLTFPEALKWLESKFRLPPLPFEEGDEYAQPEKVGDALEALLNTDRSFDQDAYSLSAILDMYTEDRALPLNRMTAFWDAFDKINYLVKGKGRSLPENRGRIALAKIKQRAQDEFNKAVGAKDV